MKKILTWVAVLCLFSALAFTGCKSPETPSNSEYTSENSEPSDSNADEVSDSESDSGSDGDEITQADILYKGSVNGEEYPLPQGMFEENGNYPSVYTYGKKTDVDGLKDSYVEDGKEYSFKGWYLDVACTQAFNGISATDRDVITLYAKLGVSGWSGRV